MPTECTPHTTRIDRIKIGDRHRKDMGDLDSLADSLQAIGLLQPIGITPTNTLVFGCRRLVAATMLGWDTIQTVTVDLDSIVAGEYAENELRKAFTISERHAIRLAIEAEEKPKAKGRQREHAGPAPGKKKTLVKNSAQVKPATSPPKSRDIAAQQSGLGSHDTATKVAKVVDKGSKDLVEAMDKGAVSINAAAKLAELPKREQAKVVKAKQSGDKQAVKKALAGPKPTYPLSDAVVKMINDIVATLNLIRIDHGTVVEMFKDPKWEKDETSYVVQQINSLAKTFADMKKELNGREY